MAPVALTSLLARAQVGAGTLALDVPDDWLQGRSVFGGLQAALALRAMRTLAPDAPLRTLQMTFVAPVPGAVRVRAHVLRTGKSATHVEARLVDEADGATQAIAIAVFGAPRRSAVAVVPVQPAFEPGVAIDLPFVPGLTPSCTQHFAARWVHGSLPFAGVPGRRQVVDLALRDPGPTTEAHVLALADFIPPVALAHLGAPAASSTLTWMLELLVDRVTDLPIAGWRVDASLVAARDGYTSQAVMLWGPGGVPVALGHQSMLVFG